MGVDSWVGSESSGDHIVIEGERPVKPAGVDEPPGENSVGGGGGVEGGAVEELLVVVEGEVGLAAIAVGLDEEVVGDDVGGNGGLGDEAVEREEVGVAGLAEEGGEDGVAGEDGRAAVGVDGVTDEEGGLVEIVVTDEGEDAVVEGEAVAREGGDGVGELGGVRVLEWGGRQLLGARGGVTDGVEGWLDAEATLSTAALSRGFFWRGEREEAKREEGRARGAMVGL